MNVLKRAVFIDRDGVIFQPIPREGFQLPTAPFRASEAVLFDGLEDALTLLGRHGFFRILVTNQPDIAYGHLTESEWERIHGKLSHLDFDDEFVCFHRKEDGCECRKPKPGMLLAAQKKWGIDIARSYMIGDTDKDIRAAKAAGCRSILVDAPYNQSVPADFRVSSFFEAARLINRLESRRMQ